ncbi:MAG: S1 RNA-binding domain-containing protein, partial [Myxococcota bacterium]
SLKEGQELEGTVVRLEGFGAFVELIPGVEGLAHISELSFKRLKHAREAVSVGERKTFKILQIDPEKRRVSLSLRALELASESSEASSSLSSSAVSSRGGERNLRQASKGIREGMICEVKVDRVESFGIFALLPSGETGLIPNAELGTPRGSDHLKMFPPGTAIEVVILQVDPAQKRIRMSKKAVEERREREEARAYREKMKSEQSTGFGTLGELLKNINS